MRKKAITKSDRRRKARTTTVNQTAKQYKDASTQTLRFVEYMPLPIVIDIKSENESDDAASYAEPFNNEQDIGPIIETLKIEINELHHSKQSIDDDSPIVEAFCFENKLLVPDDVPIIEAAPKQSLKKSTKIRKAEVKTKSKSETTRKSNGNEPKAKRRKKADDGERSRSRSRKSSTQAELVECSLCNFTCKRPSHLKRHHLMHTGEKPHKCEYCPKSFAQKTDLNRHMSVHASLFPTSCDSCGRGFPDDDTRNKHRERCNTKRYICDICNYTTFSIGNLDLHNRKHTGERPYACTSCDKRFTRVAHLNQHVKLHANDFEMHCNLCGRGFSEEEDLVRHESTCKNRMFQCHMCRDTHVRMDNLRRHIKVTHMGEKEILCEYCSKQFPCKSSLNKHIKFKHTEGIQ